MNKKSKHTKRLRVIDIFYDNKLRNQQKNLNQAEWSTTELVSEWWSICIVKYYVTITNHIREDHLVTWEIVYDTSKKSRI